MKLFVPVGHVGVISDIRAFSKNDRNLKTDTLQIVRFQTTFGKFFQLPFSKPTFAFCRVLQRLLKTRFRFGNLDQKFL
jgi:hypothetical protein